MHELKQCNIVATPSGAPNEDPGLSLYSLTTRGNTATTHFDSVRLGLAWLITSKVG